MFLKQEQPCNHKIQRPKHKHRDGEVGEKARHLGAHVLGEFGDFSVRADAPNLTGFLLPIRIARVKRAIRADEELVRSADRLR